MTLLALEDQIGLVEGLTAAEMLLALKWPEFRSNGGKLPAGTVKGPVLTPIVNHGRWLVRCPFCPSANRASREDLRFFCCECSNADVGGKWLPVRFPPETAEIERILGQRPLRHTRNWMPGEKMASLEKENRVLIGGKEL